MATDWHLLENNAADDLNGAVAGGDGTIELTSAAEFPVTGDFLVTVWDANTFFHPGDDDGSGSGDGMEVMLVTGVAGAVLTVTRAQAGTAAVAHGDGDAVELKLMVEHLEQITGAITTLEGYLDQGVKTTSEPTFSKLSLTGGTMMYDGTAFDVLANTSDADDDAVLRIGGGGAYSNTRGAFVTLSGNEYGTNYRGLVVIRAGNIGTGTYSGHIQLQTGDSVVALEIDNAQKCFIYGDLDHDGSNLGFYGTAPIAQALLATGAAATVDNVITALQNLGLVKQS